jgi:CO/xanthine dehydrogenase Mo-binding subunit
MLGPSVAIADVQGDKVTVWAGSQGPFTTRDRVANMLKIPKRNIEVRYAESAGCWGRLAADDAPLDAVLLSRAVGKPVRVQWSREDEHIWEPKGQPQFFAVKAGVDASGNLTAWSFDERSIVLTEAQGMPQLAERQIGIYPPFEGLPTGVGAGAGEFYNVPNQQVKGQSAPWVRPEADPLRTNHLRSPSGPPRLFASECFFDEVAAAVGADPVEFRLRYLSNSRVIDALKAAADKAGWTRRPSPAPAARGNRAVGRGVAVGIRGAVIAAVAEVEVDTSTGQVAVTRVVVAHDCGLIINPEGIKMQIDGNVIQGISRTLLEEVMFDSSGVKSRDWLSYPVARFQHVPKIEYVLINRPDLPFDGAAESAVIAIPAAIGNAVFDATGVRLREVPFTRERVLNALKNRESAARRT